MAVHATSVSLRADRAEPPAFRRDAPPEHVPGPPPAPEPDAMPQPSGIRAEIPSAAKNPPEPPPGPSRRRWVRWALFALLPLALVAGGTPGVPPAAVQPGDLRQLRHAILG